jgi:glycine cleavage system aminomethyltransferase T
MLAPELAVQGREVTIRIEEGALVRARVVQLAFYDPRNTRQRVPDAALAKIDAPDMAET